MSKKRSSKNRKNSAAKQNTAQKQNAAQVQNGITPEKAEEQKPDAVIDAAKIKAGEEKEQKRTEAAEKRAKMKVRINTELHSTAMYLSRFGQYIILMFASLAVNVGTGIAKLAGRLWERSGNLVAFLVKKLGYLRLLIMSPFVKVIHAFKRAINDIKKAKGNSAAVKTAFTHIGEFIFGNTGVAVTIFNIVAPIISIVFLFNIVSYASNLKYCVKLTVNDKFLGYVENEQVYFDADEILKQRINYLGSDESIRLVPTFSIEVMNEGEMLDKYRVADMILEYSDISVEYAYGFYFNGVFQGAIPDNTPVNDALNEILDRYRKKYPDADIEFRDNIDCNTAGLYLSGSIIDTDWLVSQLTGIKANAGYYIVDGSDTFEIICGKTSLTAKQIKLMNPNLDTDNLHEGMRIKIREEVPFLSVNVSVVEEYDSEVPFTTEYHNDDTLYSGVTRVTQEGANGVNHITANVTYVNNVETNRRVTSMRVISNPVTEKIALGTKIPPEQYSADDAGYGKFIWPMEVGKSHISEYTEWDGGYPGHLGIDIVAYYGAPIFAGASGTVIHAGSNYGYGNCVIIDHGNGLQTLYGHCSEVLVSVGDEVIQGQMIAKEGASGIVAGPHMHFEVRRGAEKLNPVDYLETLY
ncbi:MAG: peptidoglycan DD-metalloendopeptidase family protein [Ruminiclostridium sp.]|nr:peptidoglycan DD-metalloendopeptidase family protein [Ruminiclostridium sp.]